jgi:hypothetical protein
MGATFLDSWTIPQEKGLRENEGASLGAQTERQGEAGPVRVVLGGSHSPAASSFLGSV